MEKTNEEKMLEILEELKSRDSYGNSMTMARRKLKRKVRLYNLNTKRVYGKELDFSDLSIGDVFCMYDYNKIPILYDGKHKVMRVARVAVKDNTRVNGAMYIQPVINEN